MSVYIDVDSNPTEEDRLAILEPLRRFNAEQAGDGKSEKVAMFIRDDQTREILGGLHARIFYQWLFIELLVVPEQTRGQGMGSRLMQMAEDLAIEKGCAGIWLDTFDFQAPEFYRRHGYTKFGQIDDYPPGNKRFFFQKRLPSTTS
ncbi:GNAT family N-acetyltransferase [Pseudomonas syringae pv. tagetis]|uniref:GCN5-related N-acetyltransferase n=1 Tax=Pseudomonas syringae pv. tagetis TaxID=129140 RepID=A0A0Q0AXB0_9PSED|nr:GNAT family N-acetyltransferase [Pseudomonas syringae group genomosp. 7]KPY83885.1 GCN5-related N-acetyltransferase [Pseudomonas syringae pv. tagetis]RMW15793.1 GCN5-related N-acetyltransferase [Pseudomonas syringae pv. tagetis]RMW26905.1 GCN5-related N-acetyltransferase [Pseudomonas syringae pv. tagetis]UNB69456.1 GNAT family N-acetyltransferase [Pseudomonas syringae pv. tagetis]